MAHIIKSSIITDIRGKLNGTGFQLSCYGLNMRNRRKRKKSVTNSERINLNYFSQLSDIWKNLSLTQKQNWDLWVHWTNQHSKHNPAQIITALSGFIKVNLPRLKYGITVITTPPLINSVPTFASVSLKLTSGGLLYVDSSIYIPIDNIIVVKVSPSKVAGANITKNECKAISKLFNASTQWDIQAEYMSMFGNAPIAGESIGLCYSQIDLNSGLRLPETFIICGL